MTVRASGGPLRWTFLVPSLPRPAGGLFAVYELANAMAKAGADPVTIAHLPTGGTPLRSTSEIPWFTFEPTIEHQFLTGLDPDLLPDADVVLYTVMAIEIGSAPGAGTDGRRLIERLQADETPAGLPILFVQALGVFSAATELLSLRGAGPKVCVASWIAGNLVDAGLPAREVVHVANGLDHDTFRVTRPIPERSPQIAMNFNPHPLKNMDAGIDALVRIDRELAVPSVLFGSLLPQRQLSGGVEFVRSPRQKDLAMSIYNRSSIYLQPSTQEGFGLCAIEAMACGCALVTPANGGAADYAHDGETAVVCESDPDAMADALRGLVRDDARRIQIATSGAAYVDRFRWSSGAAQLRELAMAYLSQPDDFRRGRGVEVDESVRRLSPTG